MSLTKVSYSMIQGSPINVLDYMPSTLDYTTQDCSTYVNLAISNNPGKTIYFPTGTYLITASIVSYVSGTNLIGDGITSIIKKTGTTAAVIIGDGTSGGGFDYLGLYTGSIRNLLIQAGDITVTRGLWMRGAREFHLENVTIQGFGVATKSFSIAGLDMEECWSNRLINVTVKFAANYGKWIHNKPGGIGGGSNAIAMIGCTTVHCDGRGIVYSGGGCQMVGAYVERNLGGGIDLTSAQGVMINGYFEENGPFDIRALTGVSGVSVLGSYHINFENINNRAVWLATGASRVNVQNNTFNFATSAGAVGVYVETGVYEVSLAGNIVPVGTNYALYSGAGYVSASVLESNSLKGSVFPLGIAGGNQGAAGGNYVALPLHINGSSSHENMVLQKGIAPTAIAAAGTLVIDITANSDTSYYVSLDLAGHGPGAATFSIKTWDIGFFHFGAGELITPTATVKTSVGTYAALLTATCAWLSATQHRITITNNNVDSFLASFSVRVVGNNASI